MIVWLAPAALAAAALLALPVFVHMLSRRNARRITFPTIRFVEPSRAAAVRFRRPSDLGLLLLRMGVVLAAVLAVAKPVILTSWRIAGWNHRTARAVVLDTSRGVPSPSEAAKLAEQEMHAFVSVRFASGDLDDAIARAAEWIARTPPARRELVIVSDFQRGAMDRESLRVVPREVGLRFIRIGGQPSARSAALPPVSGWRGGAWQATAELRRDVMDVLWKRQDPVVATAPWVTTEQSAEDTAAARRALGAAASFAVPSGEDRERLVLAFAGAALQPGDAPVTTPWMLRAEFALRESALLRAAEAEVTTSERAGALVVRANVSAAASAAPVVARAAILAVRPAAISDPELETATLPDSALAEWHRESAPVTGPAGLTPGDAVEARWLWTVALALIGVEAAVRRRHVPRASTEVRADAA